MKKILVILLCSVASLSVKAQSAEVEQLLLNWEKLTQLKKILNNMYDGYAILYKGYTAVKDMSEGNFSLHKNFLDALLDVSETVRTYKRIHDIVNYQLRIVREYKGAITQFTSSGNFTLDELKHLKSVYAGLLDQSAKSLEELVMVITAGELRMSDEERMEAIGRIYANVVEQFSFLKDFNSGTSLLSVQRSAAKAEVELSRRLHGAKK
jgi:DNA repair ATPase RecN